MFYYSDETLHRPVRLQRWTTTSLDVGKHSNARTSRVEHKLRGVRSVLQMLEDDQITMHKMMNS